MARWERSIAINADSARVWQVMSDVAKWPEWTPSIELVEGAPANMTVGSEAQVKAKGTPKATWRVTEWNPGRNFTWVTSVRGAKTIGEHVIEPAGDASSRVVLAIEVQGLMAAIFKPFIGKGIERNLTLESEGLKRRSEAD